MCTICPLPAEMPTGFLQEYCCRGSVKAKPKQNHGKKVHEKEGGISEGNICKFKKNKQYAQGLSNIKNHVVFSVVLESAKVHHFHP